MVRPVGLLLSAPGPVLVPRTSPVVSDYPRLDFTRVEQFDRKVENADDPANLSPFNWTLEPTQNGIAAHELLKVGGRGDQGFQSDNELHPVGRMPSRCGERKIKKFT
jgi:hypothetical protein